MVSVFLIAGILFNIYYQYSYEKDYLSEFTEQEKHWINWRQGQILQS